MHSITRKLFLSQAALLAGCGTRAVEAKSSSGDDVSLAYIARIYSMKMELSGKKVVMQNKWNKLEVEISSRYAWINGVQLWLHCPAYQSGKNVMIREVDFKKGIDPVLRSYYYVPKHPPKLVVLDPGHGGKDTGAVSAEKVYEKQVVLDIAYRVKKHLEENKIAVRLTRTGDTFPSLTQRTDYAYQVGADLFVSIHADGAGDPSAHGVESFITTVSGFDSTNHYGAGGDKSPQKNNSHDNANAVLGFSMQSNLLKQTQRRDRGLRRARFAVLKNAPCPAVLVESGFLTNPEEGRLLNTADYREAVARGISNGIRGYFTLVNRAR